MKERLSITLLKIGIYFSFAVLILIDLLRIGGGLLGRLIGGSRTPTFVLAETGIFVLAGVMLILFHRWPWGIVIVSWADIILIFTGVFPWGSRGAVGFFSQFTTDLIFFCAAHAAVVCCAGLARVKTQGELNTPTVRKQCL
jgi:hypothetical protein